MQIFLDDVDYRRFVYLLGDVVEEYDIECWTFCAMPNHYHAALRPRGSNLSEAIQKLNGLYAQWWNKRHQRVGHVFQGRFKDQVVQREGYLPTLCRYIAMNPVRAKLVDDPRTWRWSSFSATIGLVRLPAFLTVDPVLRQFGDDETTVLQKKFADYVVQEWSEEDVIIDRLRSGERVVGDKAFKRFVREESALLDDSSETPDPAAERVIEVGAASLNAAANVTPI